MTASEHEEMNYKYHHQTAFHPPGSRGQNLLEFALVLPLLMIVVVGVLDLGRAFFAVIQVTNAAREGARYLTRNPDDYPSYIGTVTATETETQLDINVFATCPGNVDGDECARGGDAVVTVSHSFELILGWFLPSPVTISRDATMVVP
jgi:Flp pilus assembly protein TadG